MASESDPVADDFNLIEKLLGLTLIDALLGVAIVGVNVQYRDALLVGFLVFGAGRLWSALASSPP